MTHGLMPFFYAYVKLRRNSASVNKADWIFQGVRMHRSS
jgi:hypothetical protein